MPIIIDRGEWGAKRAIRVLGIRAIDASTLHWVDVDITKDSNHIDCYTAMKQLQEKHFKTGFNDILYNYLVCPHGNIFEGRGIAWRSSANGSAEDNYHSYALAYMGTQETLTEDAVESIEDMVAYCARRSHAKNQLKSELPELSTTTTVEVDEPATPEYAVDEELPVLSEGDGYASDEDKNFHYTHVKKVQKILKAKFDLKIRANGKFGSETAEAIKAVQEHFNLEVDGVVGPETWSVLNTVESHYPSLSTSD